ncbi:MAG: aldo/keto reductase [Defluviitaleaceae bacterium]|nr:aldo/keto reductase [Defluviitaleaceae bacterium]
MIDYLNVDNPAVLGFGAMRLPDTEQVSKMVDAYLDSGSNYFDTAYIYDGSEEALKKTLVTRHPRNSFVIADKLPPWLVNNHADCKKIFEESLTRLGIDYFDYYLVHSLDDSREDDVEKKELFSWVADQKKKGLVKHVGFSFHGTTAYLDRLLKRHPEVEFVQLQLNYMDILRGPAGEWHELGLKYNVPIIVMEPVKGGSLAKLAPAAEKLFKDYAPDRSIASWAMQYAGTLKGVTLVLGGMSTLEHVQDNVKTFKNLKPFTTEEMGLIESALVEMSKVASIPCTACKYCHTDCPQQIDIASCFSLYNDVSRGDAEWNRAMMYKTLPEGRRADDCTGCGICLSHCPQHIDIPDRLQVVVKKFK